MDSHPAVLEIAMEVAFPQSFLEGMAKRYGAEKARECAMSTSVWGIGPLLKERIIEQGDQGIDVIGVTLMYESVWIQTWHEWGQINLQRRFVGPELRQTLTPTDLGFELTFFDGKTIDVEVWKLAYGKAVVYFLSAPKITDVVYPGPKDSPSGTSNPYAWAHEIRLKQSWLIGRGALQLSKKLDRRPDLTILSETPTIFVHHKLITDEFQKDPFFSSTKYIFNDHTPLEYAHPIWDQFTLNTVKIDPDMYLKTPAWSAPKKTLDVTSLLVGVCDGVYGVAKKHEEVMKAMPSLKLYADKIQHVTNGVRVQDWQASEFSSYLTLSDQDLLETKKKRKKILLDWVWRHCRLWPTWATEAQNKSLVVWTRRITPYKRLDLLVKLLKNPEYRDRFKKMDIILFIGGRIHQQDNHAQDIVYELLDVLERDTDLQQQVIPVDNFNIWEAPLLFQGADGAIMMADDTREASATGFMKAQMNGAAVLATADGAVPEFVRFQATPALISSEAPKHIIPPQFSTNGYNGFLIPYVNGEPTPLGLLEALEAFNQAYKDPKRAVALLREALAVTPQVSVTRTVEDMKRIYDQVLHTPASIPK